MASGIAIANLALSLAKFFGVDKKLTQKAKNINPKKLDDESAKEIANDFMFGLGDSIKNRTKDLVLQFPVLCSDTISMETASILNKAFEYEYAELIGLAISNLPATSEANTIEFLRQFHKNIYSSYLEDYTCDKSTVRTINETSKKLAGKPIINESSLNKVSIAKIMSFSETKSDDEKNLKINPNKNLEVNSKNTDYITKLEPRINGKEIEALNDMNPTIIKAQVFFVVSKDKKGKITSQYSSYTQDDKRNNISVAVNTDVSNSHTIAKDILFGVKALIHPLKHEEIVSYLPDTIKGSNLLFKLIRWRSGELKLFRDLIFAIDINKQMALDNSKKDSFWWKKLTDMANDKRISSVQKAIKKSSNIDANLVKNKPIPTCTMVISKEDVDAINAKFNINILENQEYPFVIMKNFFLLKFVVVDESTETVFIYDENFKRFSHYNLATLKMKGSNGSKPLDIKDLVPLLKR